MNNLKLARACIEAANRDVSAPHEDHGWFKRITHGLTHLVQAPFSVGKDTDRRKDQEGHAGISHQSEFSLCNHQPRGHVLRFQLFRFHCIRQAIKPCATLTTLLQGVIVFTASMASVNAYAGRIHILPVTPAMPSETIITTVGQSMTITVRRRFPGESATLIDWSLENESAAQLTTVDATGDQQSVRIDFLEPGSFYLLATGSIDSDFSDEAVDISGDMVYFNFQVNPAPGATEGSPADTTTGLLSDNQRTSQTVLDRTCARANGLPAGGGDGDIPVLAQMQERIQSTCDTFASLDDPGESLKRIAAEEFFAIGDALTLAAHQQLGNVQSRINAVRSGQRKAFDISSLTLNLGDQHISGSVLSESTLALTRFAGAGASADQNTNVLADSVFGVFANGNIAVGEFDGDDVQLDTNTSASMLTFGADYRLDDRRVVGAALGIVSDDTDFTGDNGELDMQSFGVSAFATWYEQDKGYADIIVDISQNDFNLDRRINLPTQSAEFANSSTNATRFALGVNVGRTIHRGASEFGPLASLKIMRASVDGFTETPSLADNGAGTALRVESHSVSSASFTVGGEFRHVINTRKAVLIPAIRLEMAVENQTDKGVITASFINDFEATPMNFVGATRDSTVLLLNLGTSAVFRRGQSAFLNLETRLLDERVGNNTLRAGYRMHF